MPVMCEKIAELLVLVFVLLIKNNSACFFQNH